VQALLRTPAQPHGGRHVLFDHFWVEAGDRPIPEEGSLEPGVRFVMTPSVQGHLRSLARAALIRRFPVLLQARCPSLQAPLLVAKVLPGGDLGCFCQDVLDTLHATAIEV
jgi:midasin